MPENVDLEKIKSLVKLVQQNSLAELTIEEDGVTITIKGTSAEAQPLLAQIPQVVQPVETVVAQEEPSEEVPTEAEPEEDTSNLLKMESPMVGVFYRAPSPDSPPFVEVGDVVEVGQNIGIIEAMKVFSEIPSEYAGVVVELPVENGTLVQQGQALAVLKPE